MSDNRIEIKFEHRFSRKSDNGKAFKWLKDNLGAACDDAITNAIRLLYLPVALAEAGATRQEVEIELKKAREYFNEKMIAAQGYCCEPEANGAPYSNGSFLVSPSSNYPSRVDLAQKENANTLNGASTSTSAIEEDDDFLELDEDKLMED